MIGTWCLVAYHEHFTVVTSCCGYLFSAYNPVKLQ